MESTNNLLLEELRKVMRFHSTVTVVGAEAKTVKHQRAVLDRLTGQLHTQSAQLEEFRKQERLFNLYKRCATDNQKKAQRLASELSKTRESLTV